MTLLPITLLSTGGTIDGADCEANSSRPTSDAARWLEGQAGIRLHHVPLMNKDSRLIAAADRETMIAAIHATPNRHVILTHGTFTICQTGRSLRRAAQQSIFSDKCILLVGAWVPFGLPESDAPAQMAFALHTLRRMEPEVFIAMDGKLWNPDNTEKVEVARDVYRLMPTVTS